MKASIRNFRNHALRSIAIALFVMSAGVPIEQARAGMPVFDYSNFAQNVKSFFTELEQWKTTADQYTKVWSHYIEEAAFWQQQLNKLKSLNLSMFELEQNFAKVDADYGIDVMCPGANPSSVIDTVTSSLASLINADADIVGQQQKICVKIVRTQNRKYNDTVDYLQSLTKQTSSFVEITQARLSAIGTSPGNTEGLTQETARYSANLQLAREKWETSMHQLDVQIDLLKQQQTVLARRALNGKPSLWGTLVNTAALQGALTINK
ncbi:hypothetical protein [Luteibacter jiangsuensis]